MKSLLVAIEPATSKTDSYKSLARVAGHLATLFDSSVEVVGVYDPPDLRGDWSLMHRLRREAVDTMQQIYRDAFESASVCPQANWAGVVDPGSLGAQARVFDLTLLARPRTGVAAPSRTPVESLLVLSGRPLLLAPDWVDPVGSKVAIAWIDTPETARAVIAAMPILKRASQVIVLGVNNGRVPSEQAAGIAKALERHGIATEVQEFRAEGAVGKSVLDMATRAGANLLVKGAYTETRLKRLIFGDATDFLISHTRLPLFLTH